MSQQLPRTQTVWYLEGAVDETGQVFRVPVDRLPFRVGRETGLDLSLPSQVVSSSHAELFQGPGQLMVRDLGSTNGTFINRLPVEDPSPLRDGDILQFATVTFRLRMTEAAAIDSLLSSTATIDTKLTARIAANLRKLMTLLEEEAVTQLFQPIVALDDRDILGYEVLGRGDFEGLPGGIDELFQLAETIGTEVDLSLLLRQRSVAACGSLSGAHCFFLNTHPAELVDDTLVLSLQQTRRQWPDLRIAIEIHESSVTDPGSIKELQQELKNLDMLLVYDDFGSGQARLLELADVPPAFLKFDRSLIRDIHTAPVARVRLLEGLVKMALQLGINIIAEGLERQEEVDICRDLGFPWGQGFLFAVPQPLEEDDGQRIPPPLETE
jgi:EAL domain-containing protein (putative c-di-GMP-specific phosphodiesterase class I)